ncbi:hypothetical protein SARC_08054 [Sphaeroforma arctica JP610]|uniref:S-adenosyl-L-methionine-dependent methyltransferase n=1 Tax=Sphaeroforma arctica JP610 TaxID=667725 RepID=A0A0L0FS16_9EUKA|nr:hypothetical protein SARC_08054 [Sphaeroforma arctica JP610]KNC79555.1 hypothetical protein SARC_08054 [Sphaeroforma arctica JP610]|eukprot:XP_014153457.1 hypothetical protein SARC_08054 [Sphaeroforma arctica JP610]
MMNFFPSTLRFIALLPIATVAMLYSGILFVLYSNATPGISRTAINVLTQRYLCHSTGIKEDLAAQKFIRSGRIKCLSATAMDIIIAAGIALENVTGFTVVSVPIDSNSPMALLPFRFKFFEQALDEELDTIEQIVVLGAGFDTTTFRPSVVQAAGRRNIKIFEVDNPITQQVKKEVVEKSGLNASHITFVPCDFEKTSWLEALSHCQEFKSKARTYFLWEGVMYYLTEKAVRETINTVATEFPAGTSLAFDYFRLDRFARRYLWAMRLYGEPLLSSIDTRESQDFRETLDDFISERSDGKMRITKQGSYQYFNQGDFGGVIKALVA